ncbi:MAG TPA: cellulase family glycosylhydrolase [Baekduia sp.]|nr:cellulase family glycosylhydrolase [Baekduia sp.]
MLSRKTVWLPILLAALLSGWVAQAAHASTSQEVMFEAARDLEDPATRDNAFAQLESLGVNSLRVTLYWHKVAPATDSRIRPNVDLSDPASYDWSKYEPEIAGARARGWKILLTVTGPVPVWATKGARDHVTRPSEDRFREFMVAVSKKFGSQITRYSIWNEPNLPQFLKPQYEKGKAVSPQIYRGLYDAALRGLTSVGDRKPVLMGETAPNGKAPTTVAPLDFVRGALCLNSKYKKTRTCIRPRVDGWAHHAYTRKEGPLKAPAVSRLITVNMLNKLTAVLDKVASKGAIRKGVPLYLTEFGMQSVPDPYYGVSLEKQNEFRAIAEKIAYNNKRVKAFSQYLLTDDYRTGKGNGCCGGFESGLIYTDGKVKPSFDGFRLPLVVERSGKGVKIWGLVRPARAVANATLERRSGKGAWTRVKSLKTNSRGYFSTTSTYKSSARWRITWADSAGTTNASPGVRAYTWPKSLRW